MSSFDFGIYSYMMSKIEKSGLEGAEDSSDSSRNSVEGENEVWKTRNWSGTSKPRNINFLKIKYSVFWK